MLKLKKFSSIFLITLLGSSAHAAPSPADRHEAIGAQKKEYFEKGFFVGGKNEITAAKLTDIRRGDHGYERIAFELKPISSTMNGVPYFQVQLSPDEGRIVISFWTDLQYDFDAAKIRAAFTKSKNIKRVNILPRLEDRLSMVELLLKEKGKKIKVEAFYLENPSRVILDLL